MITPPGLRLGESVVNHIASVVNISTEAGRLNWETYTATAGVKCVTHSASRANTADSRAYVPPSVQLTKLFKLMRQFPDQHAFVGAESRNGKRT